MYYIIKSLIERKYKVAAALLGLCFVFLEYSDNNLSLLSVFWGGYAGNVARIIYTDTLFKIKLALLHLGV